MMKSILNLLINTSLYSGILALAVFVTGSAINPAYADPTADADKTLAEAAATTDKSKVDADNAMNKAEKTADEATQNAAKKVETTESNLERTRENLKEITDSIDVGNINTKKVGENAAGILGRPK